MLFQRRRWALRIIEKMGLSVRSREASLLVEFMISGAKNLSTAAAIGKTKSILTVASTMAENTAGVATVARGLSIDIIQAQILLGRLREAAREVAMESGFDDLINAWDEVEQRRKRRTSDVVIAKIIDPLRGEHEETWTIGEHVNEDAYQRFCSDGYLYVLRFYERGVPRTRLTTRALWENMRNSML
jgi:hypothetical protein